MKARVLLAHGGGGRLSRDIIEQEIVARFGNETLRGLPDAACLKVQVGRMAFSTDSFVVQPVFFPGGDIGDLAVHGTINDLAVSGARPRWLSLSMIIEEGFELEKLQTILDSIERAAQICKVSIVTGDTKVVGRGQADGIYLNTAGIGEMIEGFDLNPARIEPGDILLTSGSLAEHGAAVITARNGINIKSPPRSDTGPVHRLVLALEDLAPKLKFMRDPTRGGLAAVLNEAVEGRPFGVEVEESHLPFKPEVLAVCELLGLDALHMPCEGRIIAFCAPEAAHQVLSRWHALAEGQSAAIIGEATSNSGIVALHTISGGKRLIDWPQGELLPRIC